MERVVIRLKDPGGHFQDSTIQVDISGTRTAEVDKTEQIKALVRKGILVIVGPAPAQVTKKPTTTEHFPPPTEDMEPSIPQTSRPGNNRNTNRPTGPKKTDKLQT